MLGIQKVFLNYFKDAVFPLFCVGCGAEGRIICNSCFENINSSGVLACPVCHRARDGGWVCVGCRPESILDRQIAIAEYSESGSAGRILRAFKYEYIEDAKERILALVNDFVSNNRGLFSKVEAIVPVPLHPRRQAERGFNQAEVIADRLAALLGIPKLLCLARTVYTVQQAKLKLAERKNNMENAFEFIGSAFGRMNRVLLVDDIYTTGSTMRECARVLKSNGAGKVAGFTIARG
ncbi:MAG: ComF family protein [Patescibacteria group bacterium]